MDELVRKALLRWPNVPACTGWLALDARGQWWIRDAEIHPWPRDAQGRLDKAGASRVSHQKLLDFIQRNYAADERGYWFFQNGPQRVYVDLEAAPLVLRLQIDASADDRPCWQTHTGQPCDISAGYVDAIGRLFFASSEGPGILHSLDTNLLAPWLDDAQHLLSLPGFEPMALETMSDLDLRSRLGFQIQPSAYPGGWMK
ncbi:MAG: DUF2946 family protein [Burkholderiales bacterium]|jgi:hypothetical protein|nr:DUF2946 family protein [Burkholderiales bacterium]